MSEPTRTVQVAYVVGLKASAARVEHTSPTALARRLLLSYGTQEIYEWYGAATLGKPVFDVDAKLSEGATADALLAAALAGLATFFGGTPPPRVLIASSHGGDKLSLRLYVAGFRMRMADVKARLVRLGLDKNRPFDGAIYGAHQKLRTVGSIKTRQDARPLILVDATGARVEPTEALILDTFAQVVDPDWPLLEEPAAGKSVAKRAATPPAAKAAVKKPRAPAVAPAPTPAQTEAELAVEEIEDTDDEEAFPPADNQLPDDETAIQLLVQSGFVDVAIRYRKPPFLKFDAARTRPCPCCGHLHERQLWFCTRLRTGQLYVKSYSPQCRDMRLSPAASEEERAEVERQLTTLQDTVTAVCSSTRALLVRDKHIIDSALRGSKVDLATVRAVDTADAFTFRSLAGRGYTAHNIIQTLYKIAPERTNATPVLAGYHEADTLRSILENPRGADRCYADWFITYQSNLGVQWRNEPRGNGNQLFRNAGALWEKVEDAQFEALFAALAPPKLEMLRAAVAVCSDPFADQDAKKGPLKQLKEAVKHLQTAKASRAMLQYARLFITAPGFEDRLNRDRHLLGTPDGVLDLRTGELVDASQQPMVSMSVRPRWRGIDLPTPDVDAFFRMIFDDDEEMVDYMQALLGASITGERLEVYVCFVGAGANGKGVTVGWLRHVLGPYYHEADPYIFFGDKSHHNGPTPALAELDRKRLAVVDESNPKDELNIAIVKRVTGTDVIACRAMYQDPKQMQVTHTQILLTNNLPKFDVDDQALERRIVVVPFSLRFVKEPIPGDRSQRVADPTLARFLEGESPSEQLLVWLARGARRFYAAGNSLPAKPTAVREAESGYYRENDSLGLLISQLCEIGDGLVVPAPIFNTRAREVGLRGIKNAMVRRGFAAAQRRLDGKVVDVYCGLRLRE